MRIPMVCLALLATPLAVRASQGQNDQRQSSRLESEPRKAGVRAGRQQRGEHEDSEKCEAKTSRSRHAKAASRDREGDGQHGQANCAPAAAPVATGLAQIHGTVYGDLNSDGLMSVGEAGIAGITIQLAGPVSATVTTDAMGAYSFTALPVGIYTVCEVLPAGARQTAPTQGSSCASGIGWSLDVPATMPDLWYGSIDFGTVP